MVAERWVNNDEAPLVPRILMSLNGAFFTQLAVAVGDVVARVLA